VSACEPRTGCDRGRPGKPRPVLSVQRLSARAVLDDSPAALAHAKGLAEAGDESWEQWVAEHQRGDALLVRLELRLEFADGMDEVLTTSRDGFFVENHTHAPKLEQQIAELATDDFALLAEELARAGHAVDMRELGTMYVHVELDPGLRRRLRDRSGVDHSAGEHGSQREGLPG